MVSGTVRGFEAWTFLVPVSRAEVIPAPVLVMSVIGVVGRLLTEMSNVVRALMMLVIAFETIVISRVRRAPVVRGLADVVAMQKRARLWMLRRMIVSWAGSGCKDVLIVFREECSMGLEKSERPRILYLSIFTLTDVSVFIFDEAW